MNYQKHYDLLMERARNRLLEGYSERHHVVPRCLGGTDEPDNLVRLTPEEHYVAHQLLVKINGKNQKLIFAAVMMGSTRKNNKTFGWLRRRHALAVSETLRGRTKESHDHVKKMSDKIRGRTKKDYPYLAANGERHSKLMSERNKFNDEGRKKQSETLSRRTKENHSGRKSQSMKLVGRTKETHDYLKIISEKNKRSLRKLSDEQENRLVSLYRSGLNFTEVYFQAKNENFDIGVSQVRKIIRKFVPLDL